MVKGLDLFRQHFADYADQYVLIGGTAATLAMDDAGLDFRATKDLDIVLHIEALNAEFGATFWTFVERGRYAIRQASDTGSPCTIDSASLRTTGSRRCWSCSLGPRTASRCQRAAA
jgi:hypothetical protein